MDGEKEKTNGTDTLEDTVIDNMVFEEFLNTAIKRKVYSLFLGILYVFISYGTAKLFFPNDISTAMIMLITLLFVPTTSKLLTAEEKVERREGIHHFFRAHKTLMEIFLFLFIGISIGYLIIGTYAPASITYQMNILEKQNALETTNNIDRTSQFFSITINNIEVILIAFVLSLFYGAGALFLIVRTASVFASFIVKLSEYIIQKTALNAFVFSLHFVPEILGFLLAAVAGGVISKALIREKIGTNQFQNVIKDSTVLLIFALICIVLAALLETYVTPSILNSLL